MVREELEDCDEELGGYTTDIATPNAKNITWRVRALTILRQIRLDTLENELAIAAIIRDAWLLPIADKNLKVATAIFNLRDAHCYVGHMAPMPTPSRHT